jgi:drug/metabolite transporter (DMT)-like permease
MSGRLAGNITAFVAMILWATQFPAMEHVLQTWQPVLMAPFRLAASAILLLLLLLATGGAHYVRAARWRDVWVLGGLFLAAATVLFVWGQKYTHPVTAAILISMMPVVSALIGFLQGRERVTVPVAAGICLAVIGGYITALSPEAGWFELGLQGGELLLLAAITLFVLYTRETTSRLANISELAQAAFTLTCATIGAAVFALGAVALGHAPPQFDFSPQSVGIIAWVGGISVGLSMVMWFIAARRLGVTITTMHHNLVPFYVMVMALFAGGEIFLTQAWGAVLVCIGAVLAQLPSGYRWARRQEAV